jgi:hypothetical protein
LQGQAGFCVVQVQGGEGLNTSQAVAEGVAVDVQGVCSLGGVTTVAKVCIQGPQEVAVVLLVVAAEGGQQCFVIGRFAWISLQSFKERGDM